MPKENQSKKPGSTTRSSSRSVKTSSRTTSARASLTPLVRLTRRFSEEIDKLCFSIPVAYVYNPLDYARGPHEKYLNMYGQGEKRVLFVGMNPGPWGMVQTGVPFGEVTLIKEWLNIEGKVDKPPRLHPKRPVDGFKCTRHEPSGKRLWGLMRTRFHTPEAFFKEHFVANYCPLAFFDKEGKNVTPDKLAKSERIPLLNTCNAYLGETIRLLQPLYVIGVGQFALDQVNVTLQWLAQLPDGEQAALHRPLTKIIPGKILHPSPSNPAANSGWAEQATKQLIELGVWS